MADLTGVNDTLPVRIGGVSTSSGLPDNYADVTAAGQLKVLDSSNGTVAPGTAASTASLSAGQYNSAGVTLTNTQQSAFQLTSSGALIVSAIQSGTWNIGTLTSITNPVAVTQSTSPWITKDQSDGPVAPGTAAAFSQLSGGVYSSTPPTLTNTQQSALQLTSSGALIVSATLPYDTNYGTVGANTLRTASQIGNATGAANFGAGTTGAQTLRTTSNLSDGLGNAITSASNGYAGQQLLNVQVPNTTVAPVALGALNASVSIAMAGLQTVGFQMAAGTFIGTITPQCSIDGGTSWVTCSFLNVASGNVTSSFTFTAANTLTILGIIPSGGSTNVRVLVTAYTSGTASCILSASESLSATSQSGAVQGSGTISALNQTVVASTAGYGASYFDITGTWVGSLTFQAQNGDGNWYNIYVYFSSTGSYVANTTTVNTTVQFNCAGYIQSRVIATAWTSGTATIGWSATAYPHQIQIYNPNSAANVLVEAYAFDGDGNAIGSPLDTAGTSLYTIKPDVSATGTIGALNATLNLPINDVSSAYALISGTWVGTIQFQGSVNGTTFVPLEAVQGGPTNAYSTAGFTTNGGVRIALPAGFTSIQAVMTAYTSGTATVVINASAAPASVEVVQFNAANLNASIGSIVTDLDKTITGTISALNGTVVIATNGTSSVNASISGTWVATLVMEGQSGDGIWYALSVGNPNGGLNISSFTANNLYTVGSGGFTQVRIRASAYTSGTVNVTMDASSGSAQTLAVDADGNQQIVGNVASGTTDSGNGVKVSAVYNSTLPTFTNGQRADNQSDANGALIVSTKVPRTYSAPQTAAVGTTSTLILAANAARKGLYLSNTTATQQISLGFNGNAAAYQYGLTLFPGQKFWMDEYSFSTGAIYAITSGTATYIGIQEIT